MAVNATCASGTEHVVRATRQALLVYDVANRASFEGLGQWLVEAADFGAGGIPMAVCANKVSHPVQPGFDRYHCNEHEGWQKVKHVPYITVCWGKRQR